MQIKYRLLSVTALTLLISFSSCKKDDQPTDNSTELKIHSEDQANVSAEMDAVTNEVNGAIERMDLLPVFHKITLTFVELLPLPIRSAIPGKSLLSMMELIAQERIIAKAL